MWIVSFRHPVHALGDAPFRARFTVDSVMRDVDTGTKHRSATGACFAVRMDGRQSLLRRRPL